METNRILQFRTIVETGNFRRAAELLNISHSGLSKSIKALEAEVGFSLFRPSGRGVVVSDQGKDFFERTQRFMEECNRLMGAGISPVTQSLRIGSFETFTSYFVGPLLKSYFPEREIEIHELVPGRLEEALVYNKVDVGITYEPVPRRGIEYVKVTSLSMGAYVLRGHFQGQELGTVPFVAPVNPLEGAPSGVKGRDGWPDEKIKRRVLYRVDLLGTGLELVRQGIAAIFIPQFVARLHNERASAHHQLVALKLPRPLAAIKRSVFIVKREAMAEDRELRQIARALRDICSEDQP
jgi:DNA-binding transcriptional LysR family regulator